MSSGICSYNQATLRTQILRLRSREGIRRKRRTSVDISTTRARATDKGKGQGKAQTRARARVRRTHHLQGFRHSHATELYTVFGAASSRNHTDLGPSREQDVRAVQRMGNIVCCSLLLPNSLKKRLSKGHWSLPPAKRITGLVNSSLSGQTPGNDF